MPSRKRWVRITGSRVYRIVEKPPYEPFPGSWAIRAGMSRGQLQARHKRVFPDVWVDKRAEVDFLVRTLAAGHALKGEGVLCGLSAAVLHGSKWIDETLPAEIMTRHRWRKHADLIVRRQVPRPEEITERADFRVTTPARTAYDLALRHEFDAAVARLDALANATKVSAEDILAVLGNHPNHGKRAHVQAVVAAMDAGAESPQETRTRLAIVEHGLPRPETQVVIRDQYHSFLARVDMGYQRWRVLVEYEGGDHDDDQQLVKDVERYAVLDELGWKVIRVTKWTLARPWLVADRVEAALRSRGWNSSAPSGQ